MRQRGYLGKVFARRVLRHGVQVVRELAGGASLTGAKWIELAWHMRCVCEYMLGVEEMRSLRLLTLCFGRTAGAGKGCCRVRVWLRKVPRHALSVRGAARAPVRSTLVGTHVQGRSGWWWGCGEGQPSRKRVGGGSESCGKRSGRPARRWRSDRYFLQRSRQSIQRCIVYNRWIASCRLASHVSS